MVDSADRIGFNRYTILNLHALLADNLLSDPQASGRLRSTAVGVAQTVYHSLESPPLIEEYFRQMLDTAAAIKDPFEQSFFIMVHLPYLHPFVDVNKWVSRLAANIPFIKKNLCPLSFVDVPKDLYIDGMLGVYELNRIELLRDVYVWAYQHSSARYSAVRQSLGEPDPFRLRHRELIFNTVNAVVRKQMNRKEALVFIRMQADKWIEANQRDRFVEVMETELMYLHEGNIARYRIKPSEYRAWKGGFK